MVIGVVCVSFGTRVLGLIIVAIDVRGVNDSVDICVSMVSVVGVDAVPVVVRDVTVDVVVVINVSTL